MLWSDDYNPKVSRLYKDKFIQLKLIAKLVEET